MVAQTEKHDPNLPRYVWSIFCFHCLSVNVTQSDTSIIVDVRQNNLYTAGQVPGDTGRNETNNKESDQLYAWFKDFILLH